MLDVSSRFRNLLFEMTGTVRSVLSSVFPNIPHILIIKHATKIQKCGKREEGGGGLEGMM